MIYPVALSFLFHESSTALVVVPVALNDATFAILVLAASLAYSLYIVLPAAVLYALTLKGLARNTTYSFRIKAFRTLNGTTEFSEYSSLKAATRK